MARIYSPRSKGDLKVKREARTIGEGFAIRRRDRKASDRNVGRAGTREACLNPAIDTTLRRRKCPRFSPDDLVSSTVDRARLLSARTCLHVINYLARIDSRAT